MTTCIYTDNEFEDSVIIYFVVKPIKSRDGHLKQLVHIRFLFSKSARLLIDVYELSFVCWYTGIE